jgi:PAS domain S-box-containing protein
MDQGTSSISKDKKLKDSKVIPFSINLKTEALDINQRDVTKTFNVAALLTDYDSFIKLFDDYSKNLINQALIKASQGESVEPVNICVSFGNVCHVIQIAINKDSDDLISGSIRPLFNIPGDENLSSAFQQLFENSHQGIVITDEKTRIMACNTKFEKATGYSIAELIGQKTSIFNAHKHSKQFYEEFWETLNKDGYWNGLILNRTKSGVAMPQELLIQKLTTNNNKIFYVGFSNNLANQLYRVAGIENGGIEFLTQLPSENDFLAQIKQSIQTLPKDKKMLVISFAPKFSEENEISHKQMLASALAEKKEGFIPGFLKKSVFSIALTYSLDQRTHSLSIFKAIQSHFNAIKQVLDNEVYQELRHCTFGISVLGVDAANEGRLVSHSLQAMFEKHVSNKGNLCFYNGSLHEKLKQQEKYETIVRQSIENASIEVFYQPIIETKHWKVAKLEALCRFRDGEGELLDTQQMIQIAEDIGQVTDVDLLVAGKAISDREALTKIYGKEIEISINFSVNTTKSIKETSSQLVNLLKENQKHLPYITVELTESAYFDCESSEENILFRLRKAGLKVAIDDFGTGYSSFSYLKNGDFDLLKIDKEFVSDLIFGSNNYYIVKMIVQLAHTLNVKVVAEGVESVHDAIMLQSLSVDYFQGFYHAKPMPLEQLSTDITIDKELTELTDNKHGKQHNELITFPVTVKPEQTLKSLQSIFEDPKVTCCPVILKKNCVGVVTRELFNLHLTSSIGTNRETLQDVRLLNKIVTGVMNTSPTLLHLEDGIDDESISEAIIAGKPYPWVVINDEGIYCGVIESQDIVQYLHDKCF